MPRARINAVGNIDFVGGGSPDNSLPGTPGSPDNSLPGVPAYPDNSLPGGGRPSHPIALPPLPGIWPKPGVPTLPIVIPPEVAIPPFPSPPIYIEVPPETPDNSLPVPPGEIYPPLPPEYAGTIVAVIILGEGKVHWYHVPDSVNPPVAQPK
jgi:hypothetical protein